MALLLGVVGIYGVIAYVASQRTKEIGIRIALGALARDVTRLFLRQGLVLAGDRHRDGMVAAGAGDAGDVDAALRRARSGDLRAVALGLGLTARSRRTSPPPAPRASTRRTRYGGRCITTLGIEQKVKR